ncbi:MAG TPA: DinB family protein [Pyrinomonadaceae bacterium]|nr:DinB family protein [Pyrinomonadaceae bacterium]
MQDFLDDFHQTIENSASRLLKLSAAASQSAPAPGKWSPREVIGHLIDSASNNHQRFVRAQFTDDLEFHGYEQAEWVGTQAYNEESWEHLVQLWKLYNLHLHHLIARIPAPALTKQRHKHNLHQIAWQPVAADQPATLEYFIRDYLGHLKHHLRQISGATVD